MRFQKTILFENWVISFLDQKKLPGKEIRLFIRRYKELIKTIKNLQIRGAPAIGISGAFGVVLAAKEILSIIPTPEEFRILEKAVEEIRDARPTAVNLSWAVDRMKKVLGDSKNLEKKSVLLSP